jgi:hypothetical protein
VAIRQVKALHPSPKNKSRPMTRLSSLVQSVIEIEERRQTEANAAVVPPASQNKVNKNLKCVFLLGKEALMVE